MSVLPKLFNGRLPEVFNPADFYTTQYIKSLQTDTTVSASISIVDDQGNTSNSATETYVNNTVAQAISALKNGADGAYDTLVEIQQFLQDDDAQIANILTTMGTKANVSDLNNLSDRVDVIDGSVNYVSFQQNVLQASQSDVITTLDNKIDSDNTRFADYDNHFSLLDSSANSIVSRVDNLKTNYDAHFLLLDGSCNSLQSSVNTLNSKTSALSYSGGTTVINSKLSVNLDDQLKGNTIIGDQLTDTLSVNAITTFNNPSVTFQNNSISQSAVNGLTSKLSAHDVSLNSILTSQIADEALLASHTNSISSLQSSKADLANTLYMNSYYVNAGQNKFSDVLNSIGSQNGKSVFFSTGSHNNESGEVTINKYTLNMIAPDNAFASSSAVVYYPITIQDASCSRILVSNFQFTQPIVVDGTQGRHNWKACTFTNSFTFQGSMTNWCNFQYCTFSNVITVPSTFSGTILFFQCDLTGCTIK